MIPELLLKAAISAALGQVAQNNPVLGNALKTIAPDIGQVLAGIAGKAATTVIADPVVKNQMNAESPIQSRVVVGSTVSLGGVAVVLLTQFVPGYDWATVIAAIPIVWGAAYALYGRLASGLAPLFHRWANKAS